MGIGRNFSDVMYLPNWCYFNNKFWLISNGKSGGTFCTFLQAFLLTSIDTKDHITKRKMGSTEAKMMVMVGPNGTKNWPFFCQFVFSRNKKYLLHACLFMCCLSKGQGLEELLILMPSCNLKKEPGQL